MNDPGGPTYPKSCSYKMGRNDKMLSQTEEMSF